MRYFKIKVKNLILASAVFAVIYALIPFAYSKIAQHYRKKGESEYAAVYYEKAWSLTPDFLRSGKDIYDYANALSGNATEHSLYKIFPYGHGGAGNNKVPTDGALNTAINLYKDLIENYSSDPWAKWGYMRLAEIYMYKGEYKEAEKYLISGKANADAGLIYALYNSTGEYDKGIKLLEDLIENNKSYFDMNYYDSLANLYIQSGKYDEAIYTYKRAVDKATEINRESSEGYFIDKKEELKVKIKKAQEMKYNNEMEIKGIGSEMGMCRGRVTVDGRGIEGVRVYIKDKEIYKDNYIGGTFDLPFTITDKDGYYLVDNVLPGEYDIGIGIRPGEILGKAYIRGNGTRPGEILQDRVHIRGMDIQKHLKSKGILVNDFTFNTPIEILKPNDGIEVSEDKLEISWQNVEGAESYSLIVGVMDEGSYGIAAFANEIKENKAVIDINKIAPRFMSFASFIGEEERPTPGTLLGIYGGGKVVYAVEAYDKYGKLIGSSMPIVKTTKLPRHFVLVTQTLEGDNLIKQGQYEKARDWFIDYLGKNPKDEHSLYVLARYYEDYEKNYRKAKEYLARLYEITKNEVYKR